MGLFKRADGIDAQRAAQLLESGEAVALDVRESLEWRAGRIAGALHIPLVQLAIRKHELPRGTTIVTVCRSGHRSGLAARALRRGGFQVQNLDGGMKAWARAGLPLEPPGGRVR